ncbi:MAG: M42 family peptidase [Phycisphaerales bacterium]|nr:MAG: M42 family peptidase [Phycisphaerales bacterium]
MNIDLLKRLCETPGVPGREDRVRILIEKEIEGLFDEVSTDPLGNLIARRKPRGGSGEAKKVMLLCHMDEIGFLVSHIDDKGFVYVDPVGGFDTRNLFSRRVLLITDEGEYKAVMNPGGRPVHIASPEDKTKVPETKEFFIDLGVDAETVKKRVKIGDYVVMDEPLIEVGEKVVSKALDNRVACWLGIEAIRRLAELGGDHACEIVVSFTVQEEVGLRGAKTSSYAVKPDIGIGIDVTLSCDTPGVPAHEAVSRQGEGVVVHIKDSSFISDAGLVRDFEAVAKEHNITHQRSILARGGQDGAAAQQAAAGARAIGITVGTRYIHTVTEMIDKRDLNAARELLARYLAALK